MKAKNEDINDLLRLADKDDIWKSYLLEKLTKIDNPSKWLRTLKEKGYFDPKNNPPPVLKEKGYFTVPYWEVMGYLTKVSELNKIHPKDEISDLITEIIDSIISYKGEDGKRIENTRTDWQTIKVIFQLPIKEIKQEYVDFVDIALNTKWESLLISNEISENMLPYLIDNKSKKILLDLLDIILGFKFDEKAYFNKFTSIIGEHYLSQIVEKYQNKLFEICNLELYDILIEKIKKVISIDKNSFSSIITIEESSQNLSNNYKTMLIGLLRDLLVNEHPKIIETKIVELLNEKNPIFKRLAIYAINCHYDELKEVFWNLEKNPLNEYLLKHELYDLFQKNSKDFNDEQILRVLKWIESEDLEALKKYYEDPIEREKSIAHHKKEWLTSLLDNPHNEVRKLYEKYAKIFPEEIEHPGYLVWSSGVVISTPSTKPLETELEGKSNKDIAIYLKTYKEEQPKKWEDYLSVSDKLSSVFGQYVRKNSVEISKNLEPFIDLPYHLQHSLLAGLYDAWQAKEKIEWREVLNFCLKIVENNAFWETDDERRDWIVRKIADLIENGTRDDSHAFDKQYLPLAEEILMTLALKDRSTLPSTRELFTSVLNSTKGPIYSAMILYSLRYARVKGQRIWKEKIEDYFVSNIDTKNAPIELYVTLGRYLRNIIYLGNDWVKSNIDKIFPKAKEEFWKATITGYFYGSNKLYTELYDLLKKSNNYSKAITTDFDDDFVTRRLVEHIGIAYLNDLEDINKTDGLLYQIIEECDTRKISELVNFIWRLREKTSKEQKEKIITLWERIVEKLLTNENEPGVSEILSNLSNWITVIDDLNSRSAELLKISARHVGPTHTLFSLIDNLSRFVDEKPREVGEILNEAITQKTFLFYKIEDIQKIVIKLYEKQETNIANEICNKFWNNKQFFLKDIYDKYNK